MSGDELLFMLHSAEAGSEDFEHARAELEYRKQPDEDIQPDLEWAETESARKKIPLRCPLASVELCPRYYLSTALLGVSGVTTKITEADDTRLQAKWEKHPCWPRTAEQEPGVFSRDSDPHGFYHFCPEVMYDIFGVFATSVSSYPDELDRDLAHESLGKRGVKGDDWRWRWASLTKMHYSECPLYAPLIHVPPQPEKANRLLFNVGNEGRDDSMYSANGGEATGVIPQAVIPNPETGGQIMPDETQIDFVVLFGLQKELEAFLRMLPEYKTEEAANFRFHRTEISVGDGQYYRLIVFALREMGNYHAASATARAIDVWNPRFILLGGIAGAVKRKEYELGDVIVADQIVGYEPGKQRDEGLERRLKFMRPAGVLIDAARQMHPDEWALKAIEKRPEGADRTIPRVHFGAVVSGEKVIASKQWFDELAKDVNATSEAANIAGVEMEGYGTALAAFNAATAPGMLMAKAICDWADASKHDGWQLYAAAVSAAFLIGLLRRRPVPPSVEKKKQAERREEKPYVAQSKLGLCKRMTHEWEDLADYYDIPLSDRRVFRQGRECQDLWSWLEMRKKLASLPDALTAVGRKDLIEELIPCP
jgi:nucleoside phosphorylase